MTSDATILKDEITNFFPAKEIKTPDFSTFVSFDIETTGLPHNSEIIEIGAVKVENGELRESFAEFIKPASPIPRFITELTGIGNDTVKNADGAEKVISRFKDFAGDNILIGHNAVGFDCKIMGYWANKYKIYFGNDVFDTLRFARYRCAPFPGLENKRLSTLCDYFGIEAKTYHRAAADAEVTAKLYFELKKNGAPK